MRTCTSCGQTKQDACMYARTDTRCVQCVGREASRWLRQEWQERFKAYLTGKKKDVPPLDSL